MHRSTLALIAGQADAIALAGPELVFVAGAALRERPGVRRPLP